MANLFKDLTEDEIIERLFSGSQYIPQTPIAQIEAEMQRRLLIAIRDFNAESSKQARRGKW